VGRREKETEGVEGRGLGKLFTKDAEYDLIPFSEGIDIPGFLTD
jgi:hypothetical protein